jgi:cytochrome c oxidase subunit II
VRAAPAADTTTPADPLVAQGEKLFTAKGCIGCHSLDATKPTGIGPNLANIGSRTYIAAGMLPNTDENLARWISNAQAVKPGVLMPNLMLKPDEAKALVAYLRTHK